MNNITVNTGVVKADGSLSDNAADFTVWTPIGHQKRVDTDQYAFKGTFDGQGHTISGLYFDSSIHSGPIVLNSQAYVGLFGYVGSATIKNVTVADSYFYGARAVGGIAGQAGDKGVSPNPEIINCHVVSSSINGSTDVGGIVGCAAYSAVIETCTNAGYVTGKYNGNNEPKNVGGIVGNLSIGTVTDCHNSGSVSSEDATVGGIAGKTISTVTVRKSSNTGAVRGTNYVSGVVGYASGTASITDCYNAGAVNATNANRGYARGIVYGSSSNISNCHNYGSVSGTGVAAIASSRSTSNCYYPDNLDLSDNYAVATPAAAFTDGKVVELLNAGRTGEDAVWGQGENYPVFIPPHTHSWSYELTDAYTITATCDADGCPAPDGGSVTLSQPTNLTYDGSEKDVPPLTYTDWQLGVEAKPTVTYNTVDRANVTGQDITASITMGTGEGAKTVRVSYQVQPRVITDDMVALNPTSFDYDGQEKHPSITVDYDASLLLTENTHYQVSGASATDAGNYTVTVEGMGNYTGTVTKDWSISRKRIEFEVSISSWTFSEIIDPTQTPEVKNNYGNGSVTYWYKVYGADDSTYTQTVPTDAGTYTVKADIDETRNYEGGSATANFVIEQSGAPLVSVVSKKHAYTVASTGNTVNLADMLPPKRGATQYTLQSTTGDYITNVVVDENSGVLTYDTVAMPAPDDTGRIVVSVTMNNYKPTTITIGVEPTDKTVLTVTPPAAVDGVYNAQAHSGYTGAPSAAGYYDAYSIIYTGRNGTVYGPMADAPVNAGEYTVTFSIPADNAYYIGSTSVDFSIAKATPTGEPVVTPIYRDGKTLEDAGLTTVGGTFSVEGTVAWNDPLTTVVEEGKAYGWTFTPNDSGNYEPITGRVVVYPVGDTPVIDEPAEAQTVSAISGSTATMTVAAQGTGKLAYQWYISYDGGKTFEPIPGATQPSYTTSAVKTENNGYQYYCLATSLYGEAKSPVFTLSVVNPAVLPQTGDHSQIGLWMAMCFISIAGILLLRKKPFIR